MTDLFAPLSFARGRPMPNRLMLAPLTNQQSHDDGTLSEQEYRWLAMRAEGGFGLTMTAGAFVQPEGKGFAGQIGAHDDKCVAGLARLATAIKEAGSIPVVQLYHAGQRTTRDLTGQDVVAPSDDPQTGAREMTTGEVEAMIEAFIVGAERCERAGYEGVELHGAHTYLLCAFLSDIFNRRTDRYGGSLENRARPIREIIAGIRERCGSDFNLGLRLSVESMGLKMGEMRALSGELMQEGQLDYLDLSLWHAFKEPDEPEFKSKPLIDWFTDLERGPTRLGVAGRIRSGPTAQACLDAGADFVLIGRAAIANHDFPKRVRAAAAYEMPALPLAREPLASEGVSPVFIDYLATMPGMIEGGAPGSF